MGIAGKTLFDADTFSEADEIGRALTTALDWTGWVVGRPSSIGHIAAKRTVGGLAARATGPLHDLLARAEHRLGADPRSWAAAAASFSRAVAFLNDHVQKMIDDRRRPAPRTRPDPISSPACSRHATTTGRR